MVGEGVTQPGDIVEIAAPAYVPPAPETNPVQVSAVSIDSEQAAELPLTRPEVEAAPAPAAIVAEAAKVTEPAAIPAPPAPDMPEMSRSVVPEIPEAPVAQPTAPAPVAKETVEVGQLLSGAGLVMIETDSSKSSHYVPEPEPVKLGRPRNTRPRTAAEPLVQVETKN